MSFELCNEEGVWRSTHGVWWPCSHLPRDCLRISCTARGEGHTCTCVWFRVLGHQLKPSQEPHWHPGCGVRCQSCSRCSLGSFPSPWSAKQEDMGCQRHTFLTPEV